MLYKMLTTAQGASDKHGTSTRTYEAGETLVADAPWKESLIKAFLDAGLAEQAQTTGPTETKAQASAEEATGAETTPAPKRKAAPRRKKTEG